MKGLLEHIASWCNIISGGAFVGGVMFNTLGLGSDLHLAGIGAIAMVLFFALGCFLKLKGGK